MDRCDQDETTFQATFMEEADEVMGLVLKVIETNGQAATEIYDRFRSRLYQYQEQSHMLDPLLPGIVPPLSKLLRQQAVLPDASATNAAHPSIPQVAAICRLLHVLVMVRGYKTVVKFFPHEAADLEKVVGVLMAVKETADGVGTANATAEEEDWRLAVWEAQSTLVLWLSILITIPFDLATVDTTHTGATAANGRAGPYTALVGHMLQLCYAYLSSPGSVRDMSALLLGRLLTRPDQSAALLEFLGCCRQQAQDIGLDQQKATFLIPGMLRALATVTKLGKRAELLPHAQAMWELLTLLSSTSQLSSNVLSRKLAIKLCQRLGTTFLKPRLAAWRYTRAVRMLSMHGTPAGATPPGGDMPDEEEDDGEFEVAEEVEEVIERLLSALRDRDTVVRWSAAKGVARITGCLPCELGDEVVGSVLELFKPSESDAAWHGGCLALAELARRGLLLPARLPDVVPIIQQALQYDLRRGPCSIGAHVRDGAAYVCWAFARAYAPDVLAPSVEALAGGLLTMACYDREVNCRRAAAAAFQESVGRLGNFPHGIDILQVADYFAVGLVNQAFLKVGPYVATFPEYRLVLAQHLLHHKVRHWEKSLRELAARGLAALVAADPAFFRDSALPWLLRLTLDVVLEVRHGAVMAVAELVRALHATQVPLPTTSQQKVAGILTELEQARLYRGKGGEVMREASAHLITCCSDVGLPLTDEQHAAACSTVEECLKHPLPALQAAGVTALRSYSRAYPEACSSSSRLSAARFVGHARDPNVAVRRGYILGLGALPQGMLQGADVNVIHCLCAAIQIEDDVDLRDVESRVNGVKSLASVCKELCGQPDLQPAACAAICQQVLPALHTAMLDYSTDNRGDVGSWVREAAMQAMADLSHLLAASPASCLPPSASLRQLLPPVVSALLKQAVERIARVRELAVMLLSGLTQDEALAAVLPGVCALRSTLPTEGVDVEGVVSLEAVTRLASLLTVEEYRRALLEGLITSLGGIDQSLAQAASTALVHTLTTHTQLLDSTAQLLLDIWQQHPRSSRLASPLLKALTLLCSRTGVKQLSLASGSFASQAVTRVADEVRQCSDVMRLMDAASALCQLCTCPEPTQSQALKTLLQLLGNRYPKVRKHTAEQLYLQVLLLGEDDSGEKDWDEVETILLCTCWDGDMTEVQQARMQLSEILYIPLPAPKKSTKQKSAQATDAVGTTYQSLLNDAARGLGGY